MAGLVPAISLMDARPCLPKRGRRDKPGDDRNHTTIITGLSISVLNAVISSAPSAPSMAR
jgi:hypothetical protein